MPENESTIKFGTDGWRALIAEDFTFSNVRKVSRAIAALLVEENKKTPEVVIGYDTRFHSQNFAHTAAETLAENGCNVILSQNFMSTPAVSANVVKLNLNGGIVISASHNPPVYNGIKFKTQYGSSAPETFTKRIEQLLSTTRVKPAKKGHIEKANLLSTYFAYLRSSVDFGLIKRKHLKIAVDPMHGAALGYIHSLMKGSRCKVVEIHSTADPLFNGLPPEPIEENLFDLKKTVRQSGSAIGLATDGDADRIGIVDEKGQYYPPHISFPILLYYLCHYKKLKGKVVQTISLGYLSERIARDYNLEWEEVPIGFKYIADTIRKGNVLLGGEESGGFGLGRCLPERDGILCSLLFTEMLASVGKPLSLVRKEIEKKYGTSSFLRTDFKRPSQATWTKNEFVLNLKKQAPHKIAGLKVKQIKDFDGIEFILEDDSWLLLRPSGTEPVIRVYAESPHEGQTKKIIRWGNKTVMSLNS